MKPDVFPLPRMENCIDQMGSAFYVGKFDLLKGYRQVPLSQQAQETCAFITPSALYKYTVMPFGLCTASATFQCLMNQVVAGLEGCAVYLDDVVIHSDTWFDHSQFNRLVLAKLTVNLAKCEFAKATVTYLGKVLSQGQVHMLKDKVAAIVKFTPGGILQKLLSKLCFENVKVLLCAGLVLAAPQLDDVFSLQVDASNVGAGAVLLQKGEHGVEKPVASFSRKFNRFQLNYSVIEKEALASIWAFDVYLGSGLAQLVVYTDHNSLTFLRALQNPNQRLMRWALVLQPYHLDSRRIKGSKNVTADALSRLPQ